MTIIIAFIIGLAFGMIPFSYIIGRIKGVDITLTGSGNIGATNLGRTCGFGYFLLGFILDAVKGLIPVLLARTFMWPGIAAGLGAILGHVFNPFFRFRGGKGVSTTIGVTLGLVPLSFAISLAAWILVYLLTFIVSVASLGLAVVLPIAAFILKEGTMLDRIFIILVSLLIVFAHRANIGRLIRKQEPKTIFWRRKA
ncbi:MAG: glycerol-3-phosphate 1-O-acyltransferase PlsY [candidate division WOR-3 bacterium]|nr:MAG: glycerol-3-phosphate 1-O-acyltransferase PlsY [candidate division WOR-3 bacterium]